MLVSELKAKINTKSNFKGLNGEWLPVVKIIGKYVVCQLWDKDLHDVITVDFTINEIEEFSN